MTVLSYRARKDRFDLRIVAYQPRHEPMPEGHLRVVVQAVDTDGHPVAEDPIHIEAMAPLDLARALHLSRNEGWDLQPWEDAHGN